MLVALPARGLDGRAQLTEVRGRERLLDVARCPHGAALLRGTEDALGDADERLRLLDAHLRDAHLQIGDPGGDPAPQPLERQIRRRNVTGALGLAHAGVRCAADVEEHLECRCVSELSCRTTSEERSRIDGETRIRGHHDAGTDAQRACLLERAAREHHVGPTLLGPVERLLQ